MDGPDQSLGARGGRICCRITAFWKSFGWDEPISGVVSVTVLYGLYSTHLVSALLILSNIAKYGT